MCSIKTDEAKRHIHVQPAIRLAVIYLLISSGWILFSDRAIEVLARNVQQLTILQTYKGWFFVGCTALLLYWTLRREFRLREQQTTALYKSQAQLTLITDQIPSFVWTIDKDMRVTSAVGGSFRRSGLDPTANIGKSLRENLRGREEMPALEAHIHALQGQSSSYERVLAGRIHDVQVEPLRNAQGEIIGAIGLAVDITEQKQAEESLRRSEERFRLAVENTPGIFLIYDSELRIRYINNYGVMVVGRPLEEIVGKTDDELFPDGIMSAYTTGLKRAVETCSIQVVEGSFSTMAGNFSTIATFVPILNEDGQLLQVLATGLDISARRQAEEEVHRLNAELEQRVIERTAQLEATNMELEAFSYSVSHDLRAPLRTISSFSNILMQDYAQQVDDHMRHYLKRMRDNAQQMAQLIDDLLALSRLGRQPLQKQAIELSQVVSQALTSLQDDISNRSIDIQINSLPTCNGDPALLKQVYINLIANALKFTRPREAAQIEIGYDVQGEKAIYFVKDNGVGFDMHYADQLFAVFQRLHRADEFEGTGIGLAIAQRIIHRHGGHIWAQSEKDQGAQFYFTLA